MNVDSLLVTLDMSLDCQMITKPSTFFTQSEIQSGFAKDCTNESRGKKKRNAKFIVQE